MRAEGGITRISLANGRQLKEEHGLPQKVSLVYSPRGEDWYLVWVDWEDGYTHCFTGFAWAYGGEGPHGLLSWAQDNQVPLTGEIISGLDNLHEGERRTVWEWFRSSAPAAAG